MSKHSRKPRRQSRFVLALQLCLVSLQLCVVVMEVVEAITTVLGILP